MVNGKNVSMFASYPRSAAWELAHTFAELLVEFPFFEPVSPSHKAAAHAQAKAMVQVLRLVGEIEEAQYAQKPRQNRARKNVPIDWNKEADRVEVFAQEEEWSELIDWAQTLRALLAAPAPNSARGGEGPL